MSMPHVKGLIIIYANMRPESNEKVGIL